ncbi:hypothetical protein Tco_1432360, partial [Tanacetum coccineum]
KTVENADLKAQIQKKVFANVALKNELRKLKGNNVDTKFAKPSDLGKPVLQPPKNQSVVRQLNAFKFERPNFLKPRNSQEESYGSNDTAHNHYLEEARKKIQERNRNSKPSVMHTTSLQNTTNGSKQKPRSNNQTSRSLRVSKSSGVMSNSVTLVNSRAKVQSPKTRNSIKPVEKISNVNKANRWVSKGNMIFPNKSSTWHEKINTSRSCLSWKPTGRIFKNAGLRWIPMGNIFTSRTTKVDSEPPNVSKEDITNPYKCKQTLNVSACTLNLDTGTSYNVQMNNLRVWLLKRLMSKNQVPQEIHKQEQSLIISQGVEEQPQLAHFDDPCHKLLHEVSISKGSSSNVQLS